MSSAGERIEGHVRLIRVLMSRDELDFDQALAAMGPLVPEADHAAVRAAYESQSSTTIEILRPGVLSEGGPRPWFETHDPAQGYYWRRQRDYLAHDLGRKEFEIDSLDRASNTVLSHLEDPHSKDNYAIRGLVVGHVQSGKTQNFSALIAKSADAGYKIVIVLSGLHNTLRQQTQRRLERDLGRENVKGVGEPEAGRRWQWMTGAEAWADFDDSSGFNAAVLQGNEQVIFVVKKNKTRLERLNKWMKGRVPSHVPVLVIDDEADQASINTGGNRAAREEVDLVGGADFDGDELDDDELAPNAINLNIRKLLQNFGRHAYVAYTATPFANVLIDPAAYDRVAGADLFPRHFIISLPAPPGDAYVGAARLFGRDRLPGDAATTDTEGLNVIEFIPEHEIDMVIPPPRQRAGFIPTMTESMRQALVDYVLASAGWLQRSGKDEPCNMLIHTDMQRAMQNPLGPEVRDELAYIRQQWLYESTDYRPVLQARWDNRFRPLSASIDTARDVPFSTIEPFVDQLLRSGIEVRILNSDWPDTLDFDAEPNLKAVLIGGNKLSRGVTIEGLLVSYYVRETLYYDTLMQMARWFGYRGRYVDLTRLYSTEELVSCFHDLATAEEELRNQIGRYERENLTPMKFVPRVRKHPLMAITSRMKMQSATEVSLSFAGERTQTLRLPTKPTSQLADNVAAARTLFRELGAPDDPTATKPSWSEIAPGVITDFLTSYRAGANTDPAAVVDYITKQNRHGELTRWRVLLSCAATAPQKPHWHEDLGVTGRPSIPLIARTRLAVDPSSMGVVTEPDDELLGLSDEAIEAGRKAVADGTQKSHAEAYRAQRSPQEGLIVIYPISPASEPRRNSTTRIPLFTDPSKADTVIAYAISFPQSTNEATTEYVSAPLPTEQT